jgi:hypothetical protein
MHKFSKILLSPIQKHEHFPEHIKRITYHDHVKFFIIIQGWLDMNESTNVICRMRKHMIQKNYSQKNLTFHDKSMKSGRIKRSFLNLISYYEKTTVCVILNSIILRSFFLKSNIKTSFLNTSLHNCADSFIRPNS